MMFLPDLVDGAVKSKVLDKSLGVMRSQTQLCFSGALYSFYRDSILCFGDKKNSLSDFAVFLKLNVRSFFD